MFSWYRPIKPKGQMTVADYQICSFHSLSRWLNSRISNNKNTQLLRDFNQRWNSQLSWMISIYVIYRYMRQSGKQCIQWTGWLYYVSWDPELSVGEAHVGVPPSKVPCLGGMILDLLGFTRVPEHHSLKSTTRKESSKDIRQTIEKCCFSILFCSLPEQAQWSLFRSQNK